MLVMDFLWILVRTYVIQRIQKWLGKEDQLIDAKIYWNGIFKVVKTEIDCRMYMITVTE